MCTGPHPYIPAINTARVEMRYTLDGQQLENVFYFRNETGWDGASLTTLCVEVIQSWFANMQPLQPTELTLREVYARDLEVESGAEATAVSNQVGALALPPLPNNVTLAIAFKSGFTGRSRRGRMYWIGLNESNVTLNTVSALAVSSIVNAVATFFADVETGTGAQHVVVSYCGDGAWRLTALITPVTTYTNVDATVDSQRRRLPNRGS